MDESLKKTELEKILAAKSHELAQPIQVIMTAASLLKRAVNEDRRASEDLLPLIQRVQEAAENLSRKIVMFGTDSSKRIG